MSRCSLVRPIFEVQLYPLFEDIARLQYEIGVIHDFHHGMQLHSITQVLVEIANLAM